MSRPPTEPPPGRRPEGAPPGGNGRSGPSWLRFLPWLLIGLLALVFFVPNLSQSDSGAKSLSYSQFVEQVNAGQVQKVTFNKTSGDITGKFREKVDGTDTFTTDGPNDDLPERTLDLLDEQGVTLVYTSDQPNIFLDSILPLMLPILVIVGLFMWIMRRGASQANGLMSIGRSRAKVYSTEKPKTQFDDVAGYGPVKAEIAEVVDFLKHPSKFKDIGARIPKGVLLVGPPGTGKTLIARAVAGEAGVPFVSVTGSDFMEMFVGVGAARVRDLFQTARKQAPAIIFIDEIDAIGRARGRSVSMGANDERENTLNQLLTEMDGFGTNSGVIVLAATNRADMLDPALLRPGRFDRHIYLELPDMKERREIFKVHMRNLVMDETIDLDFLASQTPGFSGADIANICNEAALIAARQKKEIIGRQDFIDAIDRVVAGLERKSKIISPREKRIIAFHESGHALVSWMLPHVDPLSKVSIIPRGKTLGSAWYLPEERQLHTEEELRQRLTATLGGRAAEEVTFGEVTSGALDDLEKVTRDAYAMVAFYGFNEKVGNVSFYDSTGMRDTGFQKPYGEDTAKMLDEEVRRLVSECYEKAKSLVMENRSALESLAGLLLEKEVVFRQDLESVLGKRG
jgi:cell division protease FtsH